jgi:excisionase family DNA binding protein
MLLLTVQEVALMLKLSVLTIYKYIKEQKLEAVEFGGHYRIPQTSLDNFINSHLVKKTRNQQNSNQDVSEEDGNILVNEFERSEE